MQRARCTGDRLYVRESGGFLTVFFLNNKRAFIIALTVPLRTKFFFKVETLFRGILELLKRQRITYTVRREHQNPGFLRSAVSPHSTGKIGSTLLD